MCAYDTRLEIEEKYSTQVRPSSFLLSHDRIPGSLDSLSRERLANETIRASNFAIKS